MLNVTDDLVIAAAVSGDEDTSAVSAKVPA